MRTNIVLDEELIQEARQLTGIQTKRALVEEALRVLIETKRRRPLTELEGRIRFAEGYDHKALRTDAPSADAPSADAPGSGAPRTDEPSDGKT